ncbi:MAG TPA: YkgJ family cysteine cluster protein [Polyangia bacterium]
MKEGDRSPLATSAIDEIWRRAAARVGFALARTDAAYASSDGRGGITIGAHETLDDDDAFAQLVFHELCHAITEGHASLDKPDWGLDNVPEHAVREHACLRVQAALSDRFGLRAPMAPTTPYRAYYAALPQDPLTAMSDGDGDGEAVALAAAAHARFAASTWRAPIEAALAETAAALAPAGAHPLGFALGPVGESCGTCAWAYEGGRGAAVTRCRQSAPAAGDGARTARNHPACVHWEPAVDCRTCGACCREAYHSVTVSVRDPVVWQEPHLIERHGPRFEIRREGSRCAALQVEPGGHYGCTIYEHRPRPCREFAAGGRHCLDARRRVGLSAKPQQNA